MSKLPSAMLLALPLTALLLSGCTAGPSGSATPSPARGAATTGSQTNSPAAARAQSPAPASSPAASAAAETAQSRAEESFSAASIRVLDRRQGLDEKGAVDRLRVVAPEDTTFKVAAGASSDSNGALDCATVGKEAAGPQGTDQKSSVSYDITCPPTAGAATLFSVIARKGFDHTLPTALK